ncbi:MAG TPA: sulfurtransferase TusA family protein [Stellaceae bacterium]|nr:sulfurtransferase TusA family protein [Stellaceae bacterium]
MVEDAQALVDARGLMCPEPVLRTAKAMRGIAPGGTLTILATDPVSAIDIPYYCHHAGLDVVSVEREDGLLTFTIRKPEQARALPAKRPIG